MLEMGTRTKTYHHDAGRKAASAGVEVMIGVGPLTRTSLESARRSGVQEVHHETDAVAAARYLAGRMRSGDLVLVKGSRGVKLDRLVDEVVRDRKPTEEDD
jgi:UDP-N-acetylmuramoyl-tripeptide--D-alanyl-D-alanine ligase